VTAPTSARVAHGLSVALVDTHAHFVTDEYVAAARAVGIEHPDGMPGWPTWSSAEHLDLMQRTGVDRAILSISSPGVHFGDDAAARALTRHVNDFAASVTADDPQRFGFFASLPLPDVDGTLAEIPRALSLGASGFVVETSAGGVYLSDARYERVWAELDRRASVVFVHPTSPPGSDATDQGLPRPMLEFVFETTRTFTGLMAAGVITRYPHIRWIVSHTGAGLALFADRIQFVLDIVARTRSGFEAPDVREQMNRLWYDTAGFPVPTQLHVLLDVVDRTRVLYGSDFCWTRAEPAAEHARALDRHDADHGGDWRSELASNAAGLFGS
jgi:predicted TIM-barrel fold metal-dependent hydrolase